MKDLAELPNVGKVLYAHLLEAGIASPADLRDAGAEQVFLKIRKKDPSVCLHMLYGIQGAIENKQDKSLDIETKDRLKKFFKSLK